MGNIDAKPPLGAITGGLRQLSVPTGVVDPDGRTWTIFEEALATLLTTVQITGSWWVDLMGTCRRRSCNRDRASAGRECISLSPSSALTAEPGQEAMAVFCV